MVLKPLTKEELMEIFNSTAVGIIEHYMKIAIFSQPEPVEGQAKLPIQVPKEHLEQWIVQAIGASPVGAGSYPVDIIKDSFGADVKMLSCKTKNGKLSNSESGETSLAQKFGETGTNLDELFKNKKYNEILEGWKVILINKLSKVIHDKNINTIYYFFILRADTKFHLCATKVNIDNINYCSVDEEKSTDKSVFINDFIDKSYGTVKIYKSKKRMELRLKPRHWVDVNKTIEFDFSNYCSEEANIINYAKQNELSKYHKNKLKAILGG